MSYQSSQRCIVDDSYSVSSPAEVSEVWERVVRLRMTMSDAGLMRVREHMCVTMAMNKRVVAAGASSPPQASTNLLSVQDAQHL